MDIPDKVLEQIQKDIDALHELHSSGESGEFNNKKKKFVEASKKNLAAINMWLENPPSSYQGAEYSWLADLKTQIVPRGFQILTKDIQDKFDNVREALIGRRDKYDGNQQWFSSFTKDEKETLEEAKTYSEQYDGIKASKPGVLTELASLYDSKQKHNIGGQFLAWMDQGDIGSSIAGRGSFGFKSSVKTDMAGAWRKMKQSFKKAGTSASSTSSPAPAASGGSGTVSSTPAAPLFDITKGRCGLLVPIPT